MNFRVIGRDIDIAAQMIDHIDLMTTAKSMVQEAADETRIEIAIAGCLDRFGRGPDAAARMVALKATEGWQRGLYLESKGWTTLVGTEDTVSGAGEPCATQLLAAAVEKK